MKNRDALPLFGDLKVGTIFSCDFSCYGSSIFIKATKRKAILIRDWECPIQNHRIPFDIHVTKIYELHPMGEII